MNYRIALLALMIGAASASPLAAQQPNITLPNGVACPMPAYPADALKNHETGDVRISINLDLDHSVKSVPFTSSGNAQLDDAAKTFISACSFPDDLVGMSFLLAWTIEGDRGVASIKGQMTDIRKAPAAGSYQVRNYGTPVAK